MPAAAHAVQAYCTRFDFPAPGRPVTITTWPWRNRMPAAWRPPRAATSGSAAPETAARRRLLLGLSTYRRNSGWHWLGVPFGVEQKYAFHGPFALVPVRNTI